MAEVYEGVDERLGRPVAIKLLRDSLRRRSELRRRFEMEARSAARLSHPNVVAVYDTGEEDGTPYLVMERLPGESLADRLADGPVDPDWLRRLAGDVLGALGAAHAAGVVHRDIKPGNILIGEDGCGKVADFGIAKTAEEATGGDTTATGMLLGTPAYLAPERIDGQQATSSSDLYALGVVLYEALAGRKPFDGDTPLAVAHNVTHAEVSSLRTLRPDVEPAFAAAVERAMARDPAARFGSADEMRTALEGGDADATIRMAVPSPAPAPAVGPPALRRLRLRLPWGVPVAIVSIGVVLLVLVLAGNREQLGGVDPARADLAADLRELGERVKVGDGPAGRELGDRLEQVASEVEADGGAQSATELLAAVATWHRDRQLYDTAAAEATTLLLRVPGAQQPTTTTPPPPTTTAPPEDKDDDDGNGRGKGKKDAGAGDGDGD